MGALNRHSRSVGNDPLRVSGQSLRGQRVFCSNRGRRGGCGRTFCFFLANVLPRHTLTAFWLWRWLGEWRAGHSLKATWEKLRLPFALETVYRLQRRWRQGLEAVRTRLHREKSPPVSVQADPLRQTVEHLRVVFPASLCPPADFQLYFQRPFLG